MASLGVLMVLRVKLFLRFLINERIHFTGMQSLRHGYCFVRDAIWLYQRGKILIAPGFNPGFRVFPKEKSAAPTGDCENHTGVAAQYLPVILYSLFCFFLDEKATKNQGFGCFPTMQRSFR